MDNSYPNEVKKFSRLAKKWWDREGELKTLHDINPTRIDFIKKHCNLNGKRIVDIGCGGGILSEALAKEAKTVVGIDLSEDCIQIATDHGQHQQNLNYQISSAEEFAIQNPKCFDIITCFEMLEHVPDPGSIINAAKKLTSPDGDLFFSTLNRHPKAFITAILGAEYIFNIIPRGTHQYKEFIKPSELTRWARKNHLSVNDIAGLHYNHWSRKSHLDRNLNVNYIIHCKNMI